MLFRSGWRVLPFEFERFEQLYDLRMVLEATAATRLCSDVERVDGELPEQLIAIWMVAVPERSADLAQVSKWDEEFHCLLVAAAGNAEMARVHRDVTDRICIVRRLDFTRQARIDATYEEHGKILKAIRRKGATRPSCCCARTSRPARRRCARSRCTKCTWRGRMAWAHASVSMVPPAVL